MVQWKGQVQLREATSPSGVPKTSPGTAASGCLPRRCTSLSGGALQRGRSSAHLTPCIGVWGPAAPCWGQEALRRVEGAKARRSKAVAQLRQGYGTPSFLAIVIKSHHPVYNLGFTLDSGFSPGPCTWAVCVLHLQRADLYVWTTTCRSSFSLSHILINASSFPPTWTKAVLIHHFTQQSFSQPIIVWSYLSLGISTAAFPHLGYFGCRRAEAGTCS